MKGFGITFIDIDETIFHTHAKVKIIKNNQVIKEVTNQEFNTYQLKEDESFDFSEFKDAELFKNTSEPIEKVIARIKHMIMRIKETHSQSKIILLTARKDFDNKEPFLQTFRDNNIDIDNTNIIYIERSGNLEGNIAENKQHIIKKYLKTNNYQRVRLIDDDRKNLEAFKALTDEFPNIEFYGLLAVNGTLENIIEKK